MGRGSKPGERRGGRKKGTPNKLTQSVKQAFEVAFRDAQLDPKSPSNLTVFRDQYPREFIAAASKLIPAEIKGNLGVTVTPNVNLIIRGMSGEAVGTVETEPLGVGGRKPD